MVVLVVGASGNVGSAVVRRLAGAGRDDVRAAVRDPARGRRQEEGVLAVRFDYDDRRTFRPALAGVEAVFLMVPPLDLRPDERVAPVVAAAAKAGVRRIVLMTAQGVEHNDSAPLRRAEEHVEASGLPWTFVRPNWFMQNFTTGFAGSSIRAEGVIRLPAADARCAFVDVEDIAAVAAAALTGDEHAGQAYAVTGPEALTHAEVARRISEAAGRTVEYLDVPDAAFRSALATAGTPPAQVEYMATLFAGVRAGLAARVTGDVEAVLGRPATSFAAFARREAGSWGSPGGPGQGPPAGRWHGRGLPGR